MKISISCFVGNENGLQFVHNIGKDSNIHLGFFSFKDFYNYKDKINGNTKISSGHLPAIVKGYDEKDLEDYIIWFKKRIKSKLKKLVVHPNPGIMNLISYIPHEILENTKICIENFPYRKRKVYRTPLDIIVVGSEYMGFCLDLAHLDQAWQNLTIIKNLICYADIVHFSNIISKKKTHLPIGKGKINITDILSFIKQTNLDLEISLEYGLYYKDFLVVDYMYLLKYFEL